MTEPPLARGKEYAMRRNMMRIALALALATLAIGSGEAQAGNNRRGDYEHGRYEQHGRPPHRTQEVRVTHVRTWTRCDAWSRPPWWGPAYGHRPPRPAWVYYAPARAAYVPVSYRGGHELWGNLIGGATGGILGAQIGAGSGRTAAIIGGTVLGVLVGGNVGRSMDAVDHLYVQQTLESVPTRSASTWRNPDTQVEYQVTPTTTYASSDGRYCREYITTATVAGEKQQIYGTACRQPDGSWEVVR
jgi:surface antigen